MFQRSKFQKFIGIIEKGDIITTPYLSEKDYVTCVQIVNLKKALSMMKLMN